MICPFCGSDNMAATEFFRAAKGGFKTTYECRSCYYYGFLPDKLEARRLKIGRIKKKYSM